MPTSWLLCWNSKAGGIGWRYCLSGGSWKDFYIYASWFWRTGVKYPVLKHFVLAFYYPSINVFYRFSSWYWPTPEAIWHVHLYGRLPKFYFWNLFWNLTHVTSHEKMWHHISQWEEICRLTTKVFLVTVTPVLYLFLTSVLDWHFPMIFSLLKITYPWINRPRVSYLILSK